MRRFPSIHHPLSPIARIVRTRVTVRAISRLALNQILRSSAHFVATEKTKLLYAGWTHVTAEKIELRPSKGQNIIFREKVRKIAPFEAPHLLRTQRTPTNDTFSSWFLNLPNLNIAKKYSLKRFPMVSPLFCYFSTNLLVKLLKRKNRLFSHKHAVELLFLYNFQM